ncbi:phage major tail tube protein [Paenibacillus campinasensis]|uniref:Phage tail protein n=1 Tax=Paenibacillus campinasensis TaxID=66347 RepID=A0A268ELC0_9BACL|nr:phage major tail tube protein [Paenibacillus campinasensis]PAD73911.1 hypothetical protein CHH67_18935 [Paenibacillus campinasensis]
MKLGIKLSGMAVYPEGGGDEIATGDVTLPSMTLMTDSLTGAGILGTANIPTPGHYDSMELQIAWRTIDKEAFDFVSSKTKGLEIRGSFSEWDNTRSEMVYRSIKIVVRGMGKGVDLGTLVQNAATGTTNTIEVIYIKIFIDGKAALEFDRFNYISRINGQDDLADIRKHLGKA